MKKTILSLAGVAALAFGANAVIAGEHGHDHDAVRDYQGDIITNSWNNCVITKWKSGEYGCYEAEATPAVVDSSVLGSELLNVYFNFDKSDLTPTAKQKLNQVADVLAQVDDVKSIDIKGYADYLGNTEYNEALSQRRANAVRDYLEAKGYLNTRNVDVVAYGENQEMADCEGLTGPKLKSCLWRDRRVEIVLNYAKK